MGVCGEKASQYNEENVVSLLISNFFVATHHSYMFSSTVRETHPLGKVDLVACRALMRQVLYFSDTLQKLKALLQSVLLFLYYFVFNF